eukprot:COSAG06_NODE_1415_length_9535_cov_6.094955_8_plen_187_part_00
MPSNSACQLCCALMLVHTQVACLGKLMLVRSLSWQMTGRFVCRSRGGNASITETYKKNKREEIVFRALTVFVARTQSVSFLSLRTQRSFTLFESSFVDASPEPVLANDRFHKKMQQQGRGDFERTPAWWPSLVRNCSETGQIRMEKSLPLLLPLLLLLLGDSQQQQQGQGQAAGGIDKIGCASSSL